MSRMGKPRLFPPLRRGIRTLAGLVRNDRGSQAIEFVGVLPLFLLMIVIIWQVALAADRYITVKAAAMEGARAGVVVTDGTGSSAAERAAKNVAGAAAQVTSSDGGTYFTVKVEMKVPLLNNSLFKTNGLALPVSSSVTLRKDP